MNMFHTKVDRFLLNMSRSLSRKIGMECKFEDIQYIHQGNRLYILHR